MSEGRTLTRKLIEQTTNGTSKPVYLWDHKIKGLAVRISPNGKKVFAVTYRVGRGRNAPKQWMTIGQYNSPYGLEAAREVALNALSLAIAGKDPKAIVNEPGAMTVNQVWKIYSKENFSELKPKTIKDYTAIYEKYIKPKLGSRLVGGLGARDLEQLYLPIQSKKPAMANYVARVLKLLFSFAEVRDFIQKNPTKAMKKAQKIKKRNRVLTQKELGYLWRAINEEKQPVKLMLQLIVITGKRETEIGAMRVRSIDFYDNFVDLNVDETKANAEIAFPVPSSLISELAMQAKGLRRDDFLFGKKRTSAFSGWSKMKSRISTRMNELAGEVIEEWVIHDLRRTVTTAAAKSGQRQEVLKKILHHEQSASSGATTIYNKYAYIDEVRKFYDWWHKKIEEYAIDTEKTTSKK